MSLISTLSGSVMTDHAAQAAKPMLQLLLHCALRDVKGSTGSHMLEPGTKEADRSGHCPHVSASPC